MPEAGQEGVIKSQFGTLMFSISSGENGVGLDQKEEFFVHAVFPKNLVPKPTKMKTKEHKPTELEWSLNETIKFDARMQQSDKVSLDLYEYHYINDKKVGQGEIDLGVLFAGTNIDGMAVPIKAGGGADKVLATVIVSMGWENDSPPDFLQVDTATSESAQALIKQNLRNQPTEIGDGQTKLPPCEGRDFTVRVRVHKCRNLQSEEEDTRYDPLVVIKVLDDTQSTEFVKKTNNPIFDEELVFNVTKADALFWNQPIKLTVMDHHYAMPNSRIGQSQIETSFVYKANAQHFMQNKWMVLRKDPTSGHVMGFLKISIAVLDANRDPIPEADEDEDDEDEEENIVMNLVAAPGAQFENIFLRCEVARAEDLPAMDSFATVNWFGIKDQGAVNEQLQGKEDEAKCDPYVKFRFGTKTVVTATKKNTQFPTYNTALNLPIQLPALTDSMFISMWDSDPTSDEVIATKQTSFNWLLSMGRAGLPQMSARWINFYGAPRDSHQSMRVNSYFDKMDRGVKEGVDYRGRMLLRMTGTRDKKPTAEIEVPMKETVVSITVIVQALQFSMIPRQTFQVVASCGTFKDVSRKIEAQPMIGNKNLGAIFFGEELRVQGDFSVVLPRPDADCDATIAEQLPDLLVHLMDGDNIFAVRKIPMSDIYGLTEAKYYNDTMRVLVDPSKTKEGEQPTEPMAQLNAGMFIRKAEPDDESIPKASSLIVKAIDSKPPTRFLLETCVYAGRQLPAGDSNGLSDPFVRVSWANSTAQTGYKLETLNPQYDEMIRCLADAKPPFPDIVVEIWDYDWLGRNTFLAKAIVPFTDATDHATEVRWYSDFTDSRGKKADGCELLLSFEVRKLTKPDEPPALAKFLRKIGSKETYTNYPIPIDRQLTKTVYTLKVDIFALRRMRRFRMMDIKCPSIELEIAGHCIKLQKVWGANPDFNKTFDLCLELPENPKYLPNLSLRVYDNRIGTKTLIGCAAIPIDSKKYNPTEKDLAKRKADEAVAHRLAKINEFKGVARASKNGKAQVLSKARVDTAKLKGVAKAVMLQKKVALNDDEDERDLREPLMENPDVDEYGAMAVEMQDSPEDSVTLRPEEHAEEKKKKLPHERNANEAFDELSAILEQNFVTDEELHANDALDEMEHVEPHWFNRFDPEGFPVKPEQQVSRLGKVKGILPAGYTTAEEYFGPFNDVGETLKLRRGWGKSSVKAGELYFDMAVVRLGKSEAKSAVITTSDDVPQRRITGRGEIKFMARIYVLSCKNLAAKDHSILGSKSDPYLVFTLTNDSTDEDVRRLSCKKEKKFQTLNPEFFLMREMDGVLPKHNTLRISVYDYDKIGFDEMIGFTDINLEQRWYSSRGYSHRQRSALVPGSYTESRMLRNKMGQQQGSIEMWVDVFSSEYMTIPRPIDVTPPPPINLELRVTVWNTRDVVLQDVSVHGEAMTDIYVRAWLDGIYSDVQQTDVHYRSLDGTGNFNWRMIFPLVFEPRTRKIMPQGSTSADSSFFHIRREQKKFNPILKVQIYDNDLFPGTDDFIGEVNLNLLRLKPVAKRRDLDHLLQMMMEDLQEVVCCCCKKKIKPEELTLEQRQQLAKDEFTKDQRYQQKKWETDADSRIQALRAQNEYTEEQLASFRREFIAEYRRKSVVNVFEQYLPHVKKVKEGKQGTVTTASGVKGDVAAALADAAESAKETAKDKGLHGEDDLEGKPKKKRITFTDECPAQVDTPKHWFTCRGPKGAGRCGDVQLSFQLVRADAIEDDKTKYAAGLGRSDPQALPDPNRPDSSFFWLSSPYKAAIHILWKNYKWYIITIFCLVILALFVYVWLSEGIQLSSKKFFGDETPPPDINVIINTTNATRAP